MKNLLSLILFLFVLSLSAYTQSPPPNAGFETWNTIGSYSNPASWDTPNASTTAIPLIGSAVVSKSAGAHAGSWCAKLENKNFLVAVVPGIVTLGTLNINIAAQTFALDGGKPYTDKPDVFKGFYKFTSQGGDTCAFIALFYKYNTAAAKRDTIGVAYFLTDTTKTAWTQFISPIMWFTPDFPDTLNIVAVSAASLSCHVGTVLYVDDLGFDYFTGINEVKTDNNAVNIDYNQLSHDVTVSVDLEKETTISTRVINLTGQIVRQSQYTASGQKSYTLNLENQSKGMYLVEVKAGDVKKTKKIVLN